MWFQIPSDTASIIDANNLLTSTISQSNSKALRTSASSGIARVAAAAPYPQLLKPQRPKTMVFLTEKSREDFIGGW
jgi:hypothetical protein